MHFYVNFEQKVPQTMTESETVQSLDFWGPCVWGCMQKFLRNVPHHLLPIETSPVHTCKCFMIKTPPKCIQHLYMPIYNTCCVANNAVVVAIVLYKIGFPRLIELHTEVIKQLSPSHISILFCDQIAANVWQSLDRIRENPNRTTLQRLLAQCAVENTKQWRSATQRDFSAVGYGK